MTTATNSDDSTKKKVINRDDLIFLVTLLATVCLMTLVVWYFQFTPFWATSVLLFALFVYIFWYNRNFVAHISNEKLFIAKLNKEAREEAYKATVTSYISRIMFLDDSKALVVGGPGNVTKNGWTSGEIFRKIGTWDPTTGFMYTGFGNAPIEQVKFDIARKTFTIKVGDDILPDSLFIGHWDKTITTPAHFNPIFKTSASKPIPNLSPTTLVGPEPPYASTFHKLAPLGRNTFDIDFSKFDVKSDYFYLMIVV